MQSNGKNFPLISTLEEGQIRYWKDKHHPFAGGIELTSNCNFKCLHCYLQDECADKELNTYEVFSIIDELYDHGVLLIYFTGGEIFTRKDFIEIYKYAKKKGFLVSLLTNLSLLTTDILEILLKFPPALISVSLYGADEKTYRKITQRKSMFESVIKNILLLKNNELNFEIKFVVLKENIHQIDEMEKLCAEFETNLSLYYEIFPTLQGNNITLKHMISPEEIISIEKKLEDKKRIWATNVKYMNQIPKKSHQNAFICGIGETTFLIDYKGFMHPCPKYKAGKKDIFSYGFKNIWDSYKNFKQIESKQNNKCASCEKIYVCQPCPAENMLVSGDIGVPNENKCKLTQLRCEEFIKPEYNKYRI